MYPHDNIFNIYYNIGKRTPFLVKRCETGLSRSITEERRMNPNKDTTFLVEKVYPKGKYGKAYGKCFLDGVPIETYTKNDQIPCAGCGEWVLIDVPGVKIDDLIQVHRSDDIIKFGKYKGNTFGEIYEKDPQYLYWLESTDKLLKIDFEGLNLLYPNNSISILERIIDFGKYKGKKYKEIKDDTSYLNWMVSIERLTKEEMNLIIS